MISTRLEGPARPDPLLFYARHDDTPVAGSTTYAYPLDALLRTLTEVERQDYGLSRFTEYDRTFSHVSPPGGGSVEWTAEQWETTPEHADPELDPGPHIVNDGGTVRAGWLLSDFPADAVVMSWRTPNTQGEWVKRTERPEDGFAARMWDEAPDVPDDATRLRMIDVDWDEDAEAVLARKVYARETIPGQLRSHRFDVTGWQPLPTGFVPEAVYDHGVLNRWKVDDPSLIAIYGRHSAHLWPGALSGLRSAVADALEAHPQVRNSHSGEVFRRAGERDGELSVSFTWYYDRARDRTVATLGKRKGARKDSAGFYVSKARDTVGAKRFVKRKVPDAVAGVNLADALGRWDACVLDQRRQFLPDEEEVLGCAACGAQGWTTKAEAGTDLDVVAKAAELEEYIAGDVEAGAQSVRVATAALVRLVDAVLRTPVYGYGGES